MKRAFSRGSFCSIFVVLSLSACGDGDPPYNAQAWPEPDVSGPFCEPGETRDCTGPGACYGGQQCNAKGRWSSCDCDRLNGTAGEANTGGSPPDAASTGGSPSTGGKSSDGKSSGGSPSTGGTKTTTTQINRAPAITELSFSSTAPGTNDVLTVNVKATDPDGDPITYAYAWSRNGSTIGTNSPRLDGRTDFSKGDELRVTVTPSDGKATGVAVSSIAIAVKNSGPVEPITSKLSTAEFADNAVDLKCSATTPVTDPDNDPLQYQYRWWVNGALTAYASEILPASETRTGQKWSCSVSASDGTAIVTGTVSATTFIVTEVSGIYRNAMTWTAENSPYYFVDNAQLGPNVTLTVEPGVYIMGNGKQFQTMGGLELLGTAEKPIRVKAVNLSYLYGESSERNVKLSFVQWEGGNLDIGGSSIFEIMDSVILNQWGSIRANASNKVPRVERNVFRNGCGVVSSSSNALTLMNNVFVATGNRCLTLIYAVGNLTANYNSFLADAGTTIIRSGTADAKNNYWGGVSDGDIPKQIIDGNDDLQITGTVTYLPTLSAPHPDTPSPDKRYFPADAP